MAWRVLSSRVDARGPIDDEKIATIAIDGLRRRGVDRDVVVTMRARGTTDTGGGDGGGFSSKIRDSGTRATRERGVERGERGDVFVARVTDAGDARDARWTVRED